MILSGVPHRVAGKKAHTFRTSRKQPLVFPQRCAELIPKFHGNRCRPRARPLACTHPSITSQATFASALVNTTCVRVHDSAFINTKPASPPAPVPEHCIRIRIHTQTPRSSRRRHRVRQPRINSSASRSSLCYPKCETAMISATSMLHQCLNLRYAIPHKTSRRNFVSITQERAL